MFVTGATNQDSLNCMILNVIMKTFLWIIKNLNDTEVTLKCHSCIRFCFACIQPPAALLAEI